jgi:hypothetical protein
MKKSLARIFVGLVITGTVLLVNPISKSKQAEAFPPISGRARSLINLSISTERWFSPEAERLQQRASRSSRSRHEDRAAPRKDAPSRE